MIRVVKTDVLWFDGRKRRVKKPGDVFEADPELESRLVEEGVAVFVEVEPDDGAPAEPTAEAGAGDGATAGEGGEPEDAGEAAESGEGAGPADADEAVEPEGEDDEGRPLDDMTVKELDELAAEMGVEIPRKARKADIVAAIEAADEAPELSAAEVER